MVLMRKDVLYECVKTYVMRRKEDPYAFFTQSLRTRKFNFSYCESWGRFKTVNRGEEKVRVHMNVVPRSTGNTNSGSQWFPV